MLRKDILSACWPGEHGASSISIPDLKYVLIPKVDYKRFPVVCYSMSTKDPGRNARTQALSLAISAPQAIQASRERTDGHQVTSSVTLGIYSIHPNAVSTSLADLGSSDTEGSDYVPSEGSSDDDSSDNYPSEDDLGDNDPGDNYAGDNNSSDDLSVSGSNDDGSHDLKKHGSSDDGSNHGVFSADPDEDECLVCDMSPRELLTE